MATRIIALNENDCVAYIVYYFYKFYLISEMRDLI